MDKYVNVIYDKKNKTQRFVLCGPKDCTAKIVKELAKRKIYFDSIKFMGKYEPLTNYMQDTYQYAKKWVWLQTIDLSSFIL